MHNVTADQIERNKQLIALVKNYPQIYNHDPTIQSGESLDEIWKTVGQEMGEGRKFTCNFHSCFCSDAILLLIVCSKLSFPKH